REAQQQNGARDEAGEYPAGIGAGHARRAEDQAGAPPHLTGPGVRDRADRAGDADHQQRGRDRRFGVHPGHIGQQRHHQDGTPAAEQAQRHADEHGQGDDQPDHDRPVSGPESISWATMVRASQVAPRLYGSLASSMPIAQVLVSAANISPPPIAAATHWRPGTTTLASTLNSTIAPATRRTWRSRS